MTFDEAAQSAFQADVLAQINFIREPVEIAMAKRFHDMVLANFGIAGVDRPTDWAKLSPAYAQKVKRQIATLQVSGALKSAVHQDGNEVFVMDSEVPYATVHQFGGGNNIPARPYFPIDRDGECMPYTYSQICEAAQDETRRLLS